MKAPLAQVELAQVERAQQPLVLRDPIPEEVSRHVPSSPFELDEHRLLRNLRSARGRGGGSRRFVGNGRAPAHSVGQHDSRMFFRVCEKLVQGKVPNPIIAAMRVVRMTALRKRDGGRGIVAGDVIRRPVARTIALQLEKTVEAALRSSTRFPHALVASASHILCKVCVRWTTLAQCCLW